MGNIALLLMVGLLVNGPYVLITTAISADLGTHPSLRGSVKALATVTSIIVGTGSIGAAVGPFLAGSLQVILIYLSNKNTLVFNDPRKFGFIDYSMTSKLKNKKYFLKLGLDPFERKLNMGYLFSRFKNSKSSIKQLLLNQKIITGIGNIYACEILYDAKISPFILGNLLNVHMIERLIKSMRKILKKAISSGGTTLRDYISTDGTLGNFQTKFKVYNKEGKKILKFSIKRVKQCGRSTFFCPGIQKNK